MTKRAHSAALNADRPIRSPKEDKLGRTSFAARVARQIELLPEHESFVVAVQGPWGCGKTSLLNLIANRLDEKEIAVVRFNPWLFSTTEELVARFFAELAQELIGSGRKRLKQVAGAIQRYAELVSPITKLPLIGDSAETILKVGKTVAAAGKQLAGSPSGSIARQRHQVEDLLKQAGRRIVIMIDDIDRLDASEVREMMRLIRLVADFPFTTYLLAFDQERVARALDDNAGEGRHYLEKIVQISHNVPEVSADALDAMLREAIAEAVPGYISELDDARWKDCVHFIVRPLIQTPRDVWRYANALPIAFDTVGAEVDAADLATLEAVRILLPEVHKKVVENACVLGLDALSSSLSSPEPSGALKHTVDEILRCATENESIARQICKRLFPATRRVLDNTHYGPEWVRPWRRDRRVANTDVLSIYAGQGLGDGVLPPPDIEELFAALGDSKRFRRLLSAYDGHQLESAFDRLLDYEEEFLPAMVEPAITVLLEQHPKLRQGRSGFLQGHGDSSLLMLFFRLLRAARREDRAEILGRATSGSSLSLALQLLQFAKPSKGVDPLLIPEEWSTLAQSIRKRVLAKSPQGLAKEQSPLAILVWMRSLDDESRAWVTRCLTDDDVLVGAVCGALLVSYSVQLDSVAERKGEALAWTELQQLVGAEELRDRVSRLGRAMPSNLDATTERALRLAVKYANGTLDSETARFAVGPRIAVASTASSP
jgi:predicted KAP-like P-loop ATPase